MVGLLITYELLYVIFVNKGNIILCKLTKLKNIIQTLIPSQFSRNSKIYLFHDYGLP